MLSYSKIDCYRKCPYKYHLRYVKKLPPEERAIEPNDALIVGSAVHKGLETNSIEQALNEYSRNFFIESTTHEIEKKKIAHWVDRLGWQFTDGKHEVQVDYPNWTGFIDYIDDDVIIDFKYSNYTELDGVQLMLYAYFRNETDKKLYYLFIPKVGIRQKKSESIEEFFARLQMELDNKETKLVRVEYDQSKVDEFLKFAENIDETVVEKRPSKLCRWCEYKTICEKEE